MPDLLQQRLGAVLKQHGDDRFRGEKHGFSHLTVSLVKGQEVL
ncbi:hypothetical protein [Mycobacterium uberis]|nr:hypothetical protein [Mycobacterium uberis]